MASYTQQSQRYVEAKEAAASTEDAIADVAATIAEFVAPAEKLEKPFRVVTDQSELDQALHAIEANVEESIGDYNERFIAGIKRANSREGTGHQFHFKDQRRPVKLRGSRVWHRGLVIERNADGSETQYILKEFEPAPVTPDPTDPTGRRMIKAQPKNFPQKELFGGQVLGKFANMAQARRLPALKDMDDGLRAIVEHNPQNFYLVPVLTRENMPEVAYPDREKAFPRSIVSALFAKKLDRHVANFGYAGREGKSPVELKLVVGWMFGFCQFEYPKRLML